VLGLVHAMWPPVPQTVYIATTSFSCRSSVLCREFVLNEHNGLGPLEVLMALMPTSVHMSLQMKDYIATPKPNGYQSLHTTLIPFGSKTFFPLEIQVHPDQGLNNFIFIKFHKGRLQLVDTFSA
jgi:hypothetical protein